MGLKIDIRAPATKNPRDREPLDRLPLCLFNGIRLRALVYSIAVLLEIRIADVSVSRETKESAFSVQLRTPFPRV